MDGLTGALAAKQTMTQDAVALEAMKQAIQNQRQMADLLSQAAEAAKASNPGYLGQRIDIYA